MIDATPPLSITHQCTLLALSRASYDRSKASRPEDIDVTLKQALTSLYERYPYYRSRLLHLVLRATGWQVGIRRIRCLMRELGLSSVHPKRSISMTNKAQKKRSYLLRGDAIEASINAWEADITYIPMARRHF